jgi:hypothetical protein
MTVKIRNGALRCSRGLQPKTVAYLAEHASAELVNVGTGQDVRIAELARVLAKVVGFTGAIRFDSARAAGPHATQIARISRLAKLGWRAARRRKRIGLRSAGTVSPICYLELEFVELEFKKNRPWWPINLRKPRPDRSSL